jgi:O-methyltransferase involved in polyketide biosynthesis
VHRLPFGNDGTPRPGTVDPALTGAAETLLIPLYNRAIESQRPDAIMKDERAAALVARLSYDFSQVEKIRMTQGNKTARIMLTREMDRYARDFLTCHPKAVVVHVGCGLDLRYERVDDGRVEWYDLDLPEVIELRRDLVGDEEGRYHLLGCSVLEDAWLEALNVHAGRPVLFLAENVFVYLEEAQVRSLVLRLRDRFPGAELVFDGWAPYFVWLGNLQLSNSRFAHLLRWGFWRSRSIERWGEGIRLLGQWGFFDRPEPRMDSIRWLAPFFRLFKPMRIFHFQLGEAVA